MAPASDLQQHLFDLRGCGVTAIAAEDEMAAIGMALGAAFAGAIGVTVTSGPGLCLMGETLGLAVVSELPLVVVDVMRAGPGKGLPNASDQGDLLQALFGDLAVLNEIGVTLEGRLGEQFAPGDLDTELPLQAEDDIENLSLAPAQLRGMFFLAHSVLRPVVNDYLVIHYQW
jgi:hypothetical protein